MSKTVITPPTVPPIHVADIRHHLREDLTENDNLIQIYLDEAVATMELETERQLVAARFEHQRDCFPYCVMELPVAPAIQVISIKYVDTAGTLQTMPSTDYSVDVSSFRARIIPAYGKTWPVPRQQPAAVRVVFDAGYVAPFFVDDATNRIAVSGWKAMVVGDTVRFSNSGGTLPAPLKEKTDYFIQSVVSAGIYTLSATSGGAVLDLADQGFGLNFVGQTGINDGNGEIPGGILSWMLLRVETRYSYRGDLINTPGSIIAKNPFTDRLLDPWRKALV